MLNFQFYFAGLQSPIDIKIRVASILDVANEGMVIAYFIFELIALIKSYWYAICTFMWSARLQVPMINTCTNLWNSLKFIRMWQGPSFPLTACIYNWEN